MSRDRLTPSGLLIGLDLGRQGSQRQVRAGDGYPPYDIERLQSADDQQAERLRLTLAVAGFSEQELDVSLEANQLVIRGRQQDRDEPVYLFRGIAARQFQKTFTLQDGMEVKSAHLRNGLLSIELVRPDNVQLVRKINISASQ
ncbi:Hsp20 family protein [Peteryoungia desertarenae]|uniref:Hsp20 family protein n=1 Tax=Peteryoungia desertarenae TaxID=1813451 RepID=A0ABX6QLS0_9HYPH|nr:Hsp20 family protein [Peteryoungia desertarenae]QLF69217.1 Hsp20 family protein [Peteryoungia desertarenae]